MADPTPKQQTTPQKPADPAAGEGEVEGSPLELLRQNASTMIAILVAVAALVTVLSYRSGQSQKFELTAWAELARLEKQPPGVVDGFVEATQKFKDTEAEPYMRTSWAARLYESGERSKVERALELYKQVLEGNKSHPLFGQLLPEQIAKIEGELTDPRANLVKTSTPDQAEKGGTASPSTQTPPGGGGSK